MVGVVDSESKEDGVDASERDVTPEIVATAREGDAEDVTLPERKVDRDAEGEADTETLREPAAKLIDAVGVSVPLSGGREPEAHADTDEDPE
jgi:hypothetical protein